MLKRFHNFFSDKGAEISDLQNNLTYYMNAFSSSQKTLENVRALEAFLQSQVLVETIMVDLYHFNDQYH